MRFFARRFTLPLLLAAPSLALAIPASVGPHVVFHSNGVAHREVCEGAPQPGHARCHAHVVTDERGEAIEVTRSAIEAARAIATSLASHAWGSGNQVNFDLASSLLKCPT